MSLSTVGIIMLGCCMFTNDTLFCVGVVGSDAAGKHETENDAGAFPGRESGFRLLECRV